VERGSGVGRFARIALGLFVLTQLAFLFASNFLWLVRRNETSAPLETIAWPTDRYAELTGQVQGWSQYSPNVPHQTVFAMIEWPNNGDEPPASPGHAVYHSKREPADPTNYVHMPGNRLACYEAALMLPLASWSEAAKGDPTAWKEHLTRSVHERRGMIEAYFHWHLAKTPRDMFPGQLVLWGRIYRVSPPGVEPRNWSGPELIPLARWRLENGASRAVRVVVEMYDPFTKRFVPLDSDEQP
jgi:hypothetical protein